jgi:hypothetical protein
MNPSIQEALKEAFVLAPSSVVLLETLEVSHPNLPSGTIWLVKDRAPWTFTLEDGVTKQVFTAAAFSITLPGSGDNGLQKINIMVDDINLVVSDFLNAVKGFNVPVSITYRPYLSSDPTTCQMIPPLKLYLTGAIITPQGVSCQATFMDIINKNFPSELYNTQRFPGLANQTTYIPF